jgi:hypothetical protein
MRATLRLAGQKPEEEPTGIVMGNTSALFGAKSNKPHTPGEIIRKHQELKELTQGQVSYTGKKPKGKVGDSMSGQSTAFSANNSEMGTPGSILQKNESFARRDSYRRKTGTIDEVRQSSHIRQSIKKAEEEVMVLNLGPKTGK